MGNNCCHSEIIDEEYDKCIGINDMLKLVIGRYDHYEFMLNEIAEMKEHPAFQPRTFNAKYMSSEEIREREEFVMEIVKTYAAVINAIQENKKTIGKGSDTEMIRKELKELKAYTETGERKLMVEKGSLLVNWINRK